MRNEKSSKSTEELDRLFDEGGDITPYLDFDSLRRPNLEMEDITVNFPRWMLNGLDRAAARFGINREDMLRVWIGERLQAEQELAGKSHRDAEKASA